MSKTITLNINERDAKALDELSKKTDMNKTAILRRALKLYLVLQDKLGNGAEIYFKDGDASGKLAIL